MDNELNLTFGKIRLNEKAQEEIVEQMKLMFNKRPNDFDDGAVKCKDGVWRNFYNGKFDDGYEEKEF
jgi:hypothetical protein